MPPKQCPECGRFLKNAFVDALANGPVACPRCEATLDASRFAGGAPGRIPVPAGGSGDDEPDPARAGEPAPRPDEVSVRPPDLAPDTVRDGTDDVLAEWDHGASAAEIASWRADRRPFPLDTVVVIGGGVAGLIAGLIGGRDHRVRDAALGAIAGVGGAAVVRRVWRLQS